jgi:hypothetical protein
MCTKSSKRKAEKEAPSPAKKKAKKVEKASKKTKKVRYRIPLGRLRLQGPHAG